MKRMKLQAGKVLVYRARPSFAAKRSAIGEGWASAGAADNSAARQMFVYTKNSNRKCYVICGGGWPRLQLPVHVMLR